MDSMGYTYGQFIATYSPRLITSKGSLFSKGILPKMIETFRFRIYILKKQMLYLDSGFMIWYIYLHERVRFMVNVGIHRAYGIHLGFSLEIRDFLMNSYFPMANC